MPTRELVAEEKLGQELGPKETIDLNLSAFGTV